MRRVDALLPLTAILIAGLGCAGDNGLAPVTGKVTYQGKPVAGATILFMGDETARPATAISGPDGSYSLRTLDAAGAAPGKYTVVVSKIDTPAEAGEPPSMEEAAKQAGRPPPPPKRLLPAKYGEAATSPLKYEVLPGQKNAYDINLAD
jgi:hypothetical protein